MLLFGPTAVGKTEFVRRICNLGIEIINADSLQVYRHLDIGTAKPRAHLLEAIPHHLIDILDPDQQFDVGEFASRTDRLIEEISSRGKLPVVAGGTAFYLKTFACGLPGTPPRNSDLRRQLQRELGSRGLTSLYTELSQIDPEYARSISGTDSMRVMRALEVFRLSGRRLSSYRLPKVLREAYRFLLIGLQRSREDLYKRIDQRVDAMFAEGFREEIKALLKRGYSWSDPGLKGIGYREFHAMQLGYLALSGVKEQIKKNTKNYAKRQITFFKALPAAHWFHPDDHEEAAAMIESFL